MNIGLRIKKTREKLGFTQLKLALSAEITPAAISQIEAGLRIPSTPVVIKIASSLKVSTDFLFGVTDEPILKDLLQNKELQKFFQGFKDLSPKDKGIIHSQIEFLKSQKKKLTKGEI